MPASIVSDRDAKFTSSFWITLQECTGTKLSPSTAYNPQTYGGVERLNRTMEESIRSYIARDQKEWSDFLTPIEYAYNSSVHSATEFSPFEIDTGQQPVEPMMLFSAAARHYARKGNRIIGKVEEYLKQVNARIAVARNA